jgi:hypothetical protein
VAVETRDGAVENRSLIYTEYFARGTQPAGVCPLHPTPSFMDRLAGIFGAEGDQKPVNAGEVGLPAGALPPPPSGPAATRGQPAAAQPADQAQTNEDEKKKKRGFWSRLFGRGDKKDDEKKNPEPPKKPIP